MSASARAAGLLTRGQGHSLRQEYRLAISDYEEALKVERSVGVETKNVVAVLNSLANVKKDVGDLDSAENDYREALRIADKLRFAEAVAGIKGNLAELSLTRGDWSIAARQSEEALIASNLIGSKRFIASCHNRSARALLELGRAGDALPHAREAVATLSELRARDLVDAQAILARCEAALAPEAVAPKGTP